MFLLSSNTYIFCILQSANPQKIDNLNIFIFNLNIPDWGRKTGKEDGLIWVKHLGPVLSLSI